VRRQTIEVTPTKEEDPMTRMSTLNRALVACAALLFIGALAPAALAETSTEADVPVININDASASELAFLPGIGLSKAEAIVSYREQRPFRDVVELARVKGIGLKTVRKLRAHLRTDGPTTLSAPLRLDDAPRRPARRR